MGIRLFTAISIVFALTSASANNGHAKLDPRKKTVCSISLNSKDEIKTFKSFLSKKDFQFVEFVPRDKEETVAVDDDDIQLDPIGPDQNSSDPSKENKWFAQSCKEHIKCDVVVISGHFGGQFFGKSGEHLSLETLEHSSCDKDCQGVLHSAKEVFLFGCNTLAGHDQDTRTPEQYYQVLRDDNFSIQDAERIVEARYGQLGATNRDRMESVFAGVPHIYGFDSIAPSGEHVAPLLERYFKAKGNYSKYLDTIAPPSNAAPQQKLTSFYNLSHPNIELAHALKDTALFQCAGAMPGTIKYELRATICFFFNEKNSILERLKVARQLLTPKTMFTYLPTIESFLSSHNPDTFTFEEASEFEGIRNAEESKTLFRKMVVQYKTPVLKLDLSYLGLRLGWMNKEEFQTLGKSTLKPFIEKGRSESRDVVASLREETRSAIGLTLKDLGPDVYSNSNILEIAGLTQRDNTTFLYSVIPLLDSSNLDIQGAATAVLRKLPKPEMKMVQLLFKKATLGSSDMSPAYVVLANWDSTDVEIKKILVEACARGGFTFSTYAGWTPEMTDTLIRLSRDPDPKVREKVVRWLGDLKLKNEEVKQALIARSGDMGQKGWVSEYALIALADTWRGSSDPAILQSIAAQLPTANGVDAIHVIQSLVRFDTYDAQVTKQVIAQLNNPNDYARQEVGNYVSNFCSRAASLVEQIPRLLADKSWIVHESGIRAIGFCKDTRSAEVAEVIKTLSAKEEIERVEAVIAVDRLKFSDTAIQAKLRMALGNAEVLEQLRGYNPVGPLLLASLKELSKGSNPVIAEKAAAVIRQAGNQ